MKKKLIASLLSISMMLGITTSVNANEQYKSQNNGKTYILDTGRIYTDEDTWMNLEFSYNRSFELSEVSVKNCNFGDYTEATGMFTNKKDGTVTLDFRQTSGNEDNFFNRTQVFNNNGYGISSHSSSFSDNFDHTFGNVEFHSSRTFDNNNNVQEIMIISTFNNDTVRILDYLFEYQMKGNKIQVVKGREESTTSDDPRYCDWEESFDNIFYRFYKYNSNGSYNVIQIGPRFMYSASFDKNNHPIENEKLFMFDNINDISRINEKSSYKEVEKLYNLTKKTCDHNSTQKFKYTFDNHGNLTEIDEKEYMKYEDTFDGLFMERKCTFTYKEVDAQNIGNKEVSFGFLDSLCSALEGHNGDTICELTYGFY